MDFRKGMWVKHKDKVGILNNFGTESGEFHLVDEKGLTINIKNVHLSELIQAGYNDIPSIRRPDKTFAKKLGYL